MELPVGIIGLASVVILPFSSVTTFLFPFALPCECAVELELCVEIVLLILLVIAVAKLLQGYPDIVIQMIGAGSQKQAFMDSVEKEASKF